MNSEVIMRRAEAIRLKHQNTAGVLGLRAVFQNSLENSLKEKVKKDQILIQRSLERGEAPFVPKEIKPAVELARQIATTELEQAQRAYDANLQDASRHFRENESIYIDHALDHALSEGLDFEITPAV